MAVRYDIHHNEDHLRYLLDQRAARADLHGRFPSLSEFSDSPSIYSHSHFSPLPSDRTHEQFNNTPFQYAPAASSSHTRHHSEPRTPMSDRQRLDMPDESGLDLDDDSETSFHPVLSVETDDEDAAAPEETDEDTETHRVSTYGPKMTVHSRAPWETGEDDSDVDEDEDSTARKGGFMFSRKDGKKQRANDGRHLAESRPSTESISSQSRGKQSFETTSSHVSAGGALLALAQASMSSTSLALSPSPQSSLRDKLSLPRFRSRTPTHTNGQRPDAVDSRSGYLSHNAYAPQSPSSPHDAKFPRADSNHSFSDMTAPHTPVHQGYHPYANPDLARTYAQDASPARRLEELHALTHSAPHSPAVARSESAATITESNTVTTMNTVSQIRSDSGMTPVTSVASIPYQVEHSPRSFEKGLPPTPLSGGFAMSSQSRSSNESRGPRDMGYPVPPGSAPIKLISLQEAQAQARERSRSATVTGAIVANSSASDPSQPREAMPGQPSLSWTRMRSTSNSSSKTTRTFVSASVTDLHNPPPLPNSDGASAHTGPSPHKAVVRKKSGFMRLFNGKDKAPTSPPPIPSISMDTFASSTPSLLQARIRKQSTHRVPVPSITPSLLVDSDGSRESYPDAGVDGDNVRVVPADVKPSKRERQLSSRRNVPGLSIVTSTTSGTHPMHSPRSPILVDAQDRPLRSPRTAMTDASFNSLASGCANSDFVGLRLRPVSAMFSDLVGQNDSPDPDRPALDADNGTPTSNTSAISPRSPLAPYRIDGRLSEEKNIPLEDQSSVIQTLQEQIMTARRAWQQQIWELEGQVRDLKAEVDDLRLHETAREYCPACGRGQTGKPDPEPLARVEDLKKAGVKVGGVVNRPRARTGVGSRFGSTT